MVADYGMEDDNASSDDEEEVSIAADKSIGLDSPEKKQHSGIYDRNIQQFSYAIYHFAGWRFTFTSNFRNGLGDVYFCHDQFF